MGESIDERLFQIKISYFVCSRFIFDYLDKIISNVRCLQFSYRENNCPIVGEFQQLTRANIRSY